MKRLITIAILLCALFSINVNAHPKKIFSRGYKALCHPLQLSVFKKQQHRAYCDDARFRYLRMSDYRKIEETKRKLSPASSRKTTCRKGLNERTLDFKKKHYLHTFSLLQRNIIYQSQQTKENEILCQETSIESQSLQSYSDDFAAKQTSTNNIAVSISAPINKLDLLKQFYENEVKKMPKLNRFGSEEWKVDQTFIFIIQDEYALAA